MMLVRPGWWLLMGAPILWGAPESPVGLVLASSSGRLLRAQTNLDLAARPGDLLFAGDSLRGNGAALTFLFCPQRTTATLSPDGAATLEAARVNVKSGRIAGRSPTASCVLPQTVRVSVASQQHYAVSLVRPLDAARPGAATFAERMQALAAPQRAALGAELGPIDREIAARPGDQVPRVARAAVLQKYGMRIDAAIEYRGILQAWPDAVWIFSHLFELEDQRAAPKAAPAPAAPSGRTFALIVGISRYQSEKITPLIYATRDAALIEAFLKSPRGGELPDTQVTTLLDDAARTPAIRLGITTFLKTRATSEDTVLVFIAAHGTVDPKTGKAYVVTYDTDPEDLGVTALAFADLQELFRKELSGVRRAMIYLDACHAGKLGSVEIRSVNDAVAPLTRGSTNEVFSFLASGKDEESEEGPQYGGGHGAFTHFLVDGLNGSADNAPPDGKVDFNEFVDYVRGMVRKSTEFRQNPVHVGELGRKTIMADSGRGPAMAIERWPTAGVTASSLPPRTRGLDPRSEAPPVRALQEALAAGRVLPGESGSAFAALPALRSSLPPESYLEQENQLRLALENRGRETILRYLRGEQDPQTRADFLAGAAYFAAAQTLSPESLLLESQKAFCLGRAALFEPKDPARAFDLLERAARLDAGSAYSYNALGIAYLARGSFYQAEQAFLDAIRRAPHWIYPRHNLALTYAETGAYRAAERTYREALRLQPGYSYVHYSLGTLLAKLGRTRDAAAGYRAALEIDPDHAESYTGLGALDAAAGRYPDAERNYRAALRINPKLAPAAHNLALLYLKWKQPDRAIRAWEESLRLNPGFVPSRMSLAAAYRDRSRLDDAVAQYREVIAVSPNYTAARVALHETTGDRFRQQGDVAAAQREWELARGLAVGADRRRIERKLRK